MRKSISLIALAMMVAALCGCAAALVGTAMVGTGAGTYVFVNSELKTDYYYSFDQVWAATEKTIASMRGTEVVPDKGIGKGSIDAVISGEKVHINILYKDKNITNVGIRVGIVGNEAASKMIHGNILDNLKK
ncbi:MAG: hypothetical protein CSYNP_03464 [Syntrophus sp. SKADARSKE-3]|nr:hypothetical protein [Syntrophus sp. SKADARSKE-3]